MVTSLGLSFKNHSSLNWNLIFHIDLDLKVELQFYYLQLVTLEHYLDFLTFIRFFIWLHMTLWGLPLIIYRHLPDIKLKNWVMARIGHLKPHNDSLLMCTLQEFIYLTWQTSVCHLHVQLCQCSVVSFTVLQDLHSNTPSSLYSNSNALKRCFQQRTVSAEQSLCSCSRAPSSGGKLIKRLNSFRHYPHAEWFSDFCMCSL